MVYANMNNIPDDLRVVSTYICDRKATNCTLMRICHTRDSITNLHVDAIVNAANSQLRGGGGVDGAIHEAAGPRLKEEIQMLYPEGCQAGDAVISDAFNLPCRKVIHAVGPVYSEDDHKEAVRLLASAYRRSLELAMDNACDTVAFAAISAGIYGFPLRHQAEVALRTVKEYLEDEKQKGGVRAHFTHIVFCSLPEDVYEVYEQLIP